MSTYVDFFYRIEGKPAALAKARELILKFQSEWEDRDGLENEPKEVEPGCLEWSGFTAANLQDFDDKLAKLTRRGAVSAYTYQGSTDGCCEGGLYNIEKGSQYVVRRWEADIGVWAATSAIRLAQGPCVKSFVHLAHQMRLASFDHWDEDDSSNLMDAGVCATLMAEGVREHPEMLASAEVVAALRVNAAQLSLVRDGLREFQAMAPSDILKVEGLLATIDGLEIASVVPIVDQPINSISERARL